ncbi:high-potential iron-sulfur protein [Undibacterium sp. Jales W-56]|uniref:high-potential iron-sulfur protein n=1 Tax=Undibacterium sp. Jales W-56 TaxID=2897325 RepID=UPI003977AC83
MTSRRQFILTSLPSAAVLLSGASIATAQAARLEESDPIAVALGYKHDAGKVDTKKYAAFAAGHNCANCQLFQGKPADAWGVCGAVGGKQVNAKGWCSAWNKKA